MITKCKLCHKRKECEKYPLGYICACQPFLLKQQVRIEQLMKANDTLREINNRLEVDKIEELEK